MSVPTEDFRRQYDGNDSATTFVYPFKISSKTFLKVTKRVVSTGVDTVLTVDTDYTVNGVGSDDSGDWDITYPVSGSPLATGETLTIIPANPFEQNTAYGNQSAYFPKTIEASFDYLTILTQRLFEELSRCIRFPVADTNPSTDLPSDTLRAGNIFSFDSLGAIDLIPSVSTSTGAAAASAAAALASQTAAGVSQTASAASAAAAVVSAAAAAASATAAAAASGRTEPVVINGNFDVWNEGTSFAGLTGAQNLTIAEGFRWAANLGTAVVTASQQGDVPDAKSQWSLKMLATTGQSSISAGDIAELSYALEGNNFRQIAQQQFTMHFWIKASKTGTFCVAFRNYGTDRSYVAEVTINAANTWEEKTITVLATPSAGTWKYDTNQGLYIDFTLASGSTYRTTAGSWQTGNFVSTANQTNFLASTNDYVMLSQVDIRLGSSFSTYLSPDIDKELQRTKHYYQKSYTLADAPGTSSVDGDLIQGYVENNTYMRDMTKTLPVEMRATPTITPYSYTGASGKIRDMDAPADRTVVVVNASTKGFSLQSSPAAFVGGNRLQGHWVANARL